MRFRDKAAAIIRRFPYNNDEPEGGKTVAARLEGRIAFITAAGQGMGRAAAEAFAAEGAEVWATDIDPALLRTLDGKARIRTRVLDVTDGKAVDRVAAEVGAVDVLFNCAGYVAHGNLMDCSEADWDRSFEINIKSMYRVTRAFLPGMLARGGGSIINMSSIASSVKGLPNRLAYGTTKAAVIGFTKAVAADYVKQGIRCNAVCPGTIDTPSLQGRINALPDPAQARRDFVARQPMGRLGTVEDMVPLFIYLASDESRFATGAAFSVDGGMTI
jgi:2-keto-3-deoxy-L-fuconate dehydrogenase